MALILNALRVSIMWLQEEFQVSPVVSDVDLDVALWFLM